MSGSALQQTFFVPGIPFLAAAEEARYTALFPATSQWEKGLFSTNNLHTTYYVSRAKKEKALIVGCGGFSTHYLFDPEQIEDLNKAGISIIWMVLPDVKRRTGFMPEYDELVRDFLISQRSPVHRIFPPNISKCLATFSTSGQIVLRQMHHPETNRRLHHLYCGAVHISTFIDTANASYESGGWVNRLAFNAYANRHLNNLPSETPLGRAFIRRRAQSEPFKDRAGNLSPTYAQILEIQKWGRSLAANFNPKAAGALPSLFIMSKEDPFACTQTVFTMAAQMGARMVTQGLGHDPIRTAPAIMNHIVSHVFRACAVREGFLPDYVSSVSNIENDSAPFSVRIENLSDRASLALQRGAGLLYATTGFFQGTLRRGIGNAEMR